MTKITLKTIPCIKDQAYFIMIGLSGSWVFDATYPQNQDEDWCKNWVGQYTDTCGWDDECIQEMIDDGYEDLLEYRKVKFLDIIKRLGDKETTVDTILSSRKDGYKICSLLAKVGDSESHYFLRDA